MKRKVIVFLLLFLTSCGSIKMSPQGCKTDKGSWGPSRDESSLMTEESFSKSYFLLGRDEEVRLKDFLKDHKVQCQDVKKIRVEISSTFFMWREIKIFIQK